MTGDKCVNIWLYIIVFSDSFPWREAGWVRELPGQVRAAAAWWAADRGDVLVAADGRDLRLHGRECARLACLGAPCARAALLPGALACGARAPAGPLLRLCGAGTTSHCSRGRSRYLKDSLRDVVWIYLKGIFLGVGTIDISRRLPLGWLWRRPSAQQRISLLCFHTHKLNLKNKKISLCSFTYSPSDL